MSVSRFVSFAIAVVISAIQWTVFLIPTASTRSVQAVSIPVADDGSADSLPVAVIVAHRQS